MDRLPDRRLRILYAAGPGDVVGTFRHWKQGYDDPSQVAITYSGQFYEVCDQLGAEAYVISYCDRRDRVADGPFRVENRPAPVSLDAPGPLYRLGQVWAGLRFTATAWRFRPDVMLTMGGAEWFSLGLIPRLLGVKVIVTFHGHLWRVARPPGGIDRFLWKLNGRFFRRYGKAFMYISDSIADQLRTLIGPSDVPVLRSRPSSRAELFRPAPSAPPPPAPPYRVFYAGRIEHNKGVFDLLDVAKRFVAEGRNDVEFDLCGDGSALEELCRRAREAGLSDRFRCHGHVQKRQMAGWYQKAHMIVAPTTSESIEGLNKVVVEAVLAGRPVVTSRVCPALEYVRDAVLEVPPDDTRAYGDAILRLIDEKALYEEKRRGCAASTEQFYDPAQGWGATLRKALRLIGAIPDTNQAPAGIPLEVAASRAC